MGPLFPFAGLGGLMDNVADRIACHALLSLLAGLLLFPATAVAQWRLDGVDVGVAAGAQTETAAISDGADGAIITWQDTRNGAADIYVQRVDASGAPFWAADGINLCNAANDQLEPKIVADGSGGAIVTWHDRRTANYHIYAQRVSFGGIAQWTANGVPVCTAANDQISPQITTDAAGGAIILWQDYRAGGGMIHVYAQRLDAAGTPKWTANGIPLSTAPVTFWPRLCPDGSGGAVATWMDLQTTDFNIHAQRVSAGGLVQWPTNGVVVCTAANDQERPSIVSDGSSGAIIAWQDLRGGSTYDIYAQHISAGGVAKWATNGVRVSFAGNHQITPNLIADGASGVIVTWEDRRGTDEDVYAQRLDSSGVAQWTLDGLGVCTAEWAQYNPVILADGSGGAIVSWNDYRSGGSDVYAQRVDAFGTAQWTTDGVPVCAPSRDQLLPSLAPDGAGGAIVAWHDLRSSTGADVYAQRIEPRFGYWGHPEATLATVADVPADQGSRVAVNWYASGREILHQPLISHYSIWRATDFAGAASAARAGIPAVALDAIDRSFFGPAIRAETRGGADYFWEFVGTQDAIKRSAYTFAAPTSHDSTSEGSAVHQFQVVAHANGSQYVNWPSNVVSGYSVDDLAPAAPLELTAQRNGPDVQLRWSRVVTGDLRDYAIYRATSAGVMPDPIHFLASAGETTFVDVDAEEPSLYYVVTAYDVHENESAPSNEASVGPTTDVPSTLSIAGLTVLPNHPNPFAGRTDFSIGLPAPSDVEIDVFDVTGRRVRTLAVPEVASGWNRIPFFGVDDRGRPLARGVYFYRVSAGGATAADRLVIVR